MPKCLLRHDVVRVFVSFLVLVFVRAIFFMVPLNMTYLHCLQHSLFEHLFNLYYTNQSRHKTNHTVQDTTNKYRRWCFFHYVRTNFLCFSDFYLLFIIYKMISPRKLPPWYSQWLSLGFKPVISYSKPHQNIWEEVLLKCKQLVISFRPVILCLFW